MTPDERTALLAFWKAVPEARPNRIVVGRGDIYLDGVGSDGVGISQCELPLEDDELSALACDSIERWMASRGVQAEVTNHTDGQASVRLWLDDDREPFYDCDAMPKLSALLAAADAVADGSKP